MAAHVSEETRMIPPAVLERVAASAAGISSDGLEAEVEQLRARERSAVLEYRFQGGQKVIAKRYAQPGDALASYEVLRALWQRGFGPGSRYRVPEPLGYYADWGVLVMRPAPGLRLSTLVERPGPWEEGLRAAGNWLARLHAVSADPEPREDVTRETLRLARRAAIAGAHHPERETLRLARRAAIAGAHHPELEPLLVGLIDELERRASKVAGPESWTQTHGRYHARHVFVASDAVTVIDLDRVAVTDPAKDLGEFLHRLRAHSRRARLGDEAADGAAHAFLEGYATDAPAIPGGLIYYWSYSILSTLLRLLELERNKWERRLEFYRAEFEAVPLRARALGRLSR
jgi:hypothetical protein